MEYKMIVLDLDGTLTNRDKIITPRTKQALMEALQESGAAGGGDVTIVVNLDGREVARNTVRHINQMTRSGGRSPLLV